MFVVLKKNPDEKELQSLKSTLSSKGIEVHEFESMSRRVLGLEGDTSYIDTELLAALDIVDSVRRIKEPFKHSARSNHRDNTVIEVSGRKIGDGGLTIIAGPCSVESEEQVISIAKAVKKSGATMLRGGAFKPRTSPYTFQGLKAKGLEYLKLAREATGLPIVTEILDLSQLPLFEDIDVIQVGARNMQNYELLKELGKLDKPILLKRGIAATYEDLLMSAEYIMDGGNEKVILCERGIRTFETYTRNTMDVSAVPALKELSHLPVIVDPSHSSGRSNLVSPLSLAACAAGCDGLLIEVHNDPPHALSDGKQSLRLDEFDALVGKLHAVYEAVNK